MAEDLAFQSATRLLALYRTKDLSPAEVMGETLRRLERYEGALNAFVLYDPGGGDDAGASLGGALAERRT
jgi:Asp-tRNA(Asn)/Glu-tRNA(Gln) amidotransferase A subunit family amidase